MQVNSFKAQNESAREKIDKLRRYILNSKPRKVNQLSRLLKNVRNSGYIFQATCIWG